MSYLSKPAAESLGDLLDACAQVQPGQHIMVLASVDGLHGGDNLVDQDTVEWIQQGVRQRGALPTVVWADLDNRVHAWTVPPVVKAGIAGSDLLISHGFDLPFEELIELRRTLADAGVPMVRNMATTGSLLSSDWARTPYELVSEIRYQTAAMFDSGRRWTLSHSNGTHLQGEVGSPIPPFKHYAERRSEGLYRPFPEGVFTPITVENTTGTLVFDRTLTWWSRYIGAGPRFSHGVHADVRDNRIVAFQGGEEAEAFERFFAELSHRLGSSVYDLAGLHGGVHPHAIVPAQHCPNAGYREFIEHHHASSLHLHLGRANDENYPYMLHITAELRGAVLEVGGATVYNEEGSVALGHPAVRSIASRYPNRPGIRGLFQKETV